MKRLITLLSLATLFSCCGPIERKVAPSKFVFRIESIRTVEESQGIYSKYFISMTDTLFDGNSMPSIQSVNFFVVDTSGKYDANTKLILTLQPDTTIQTEE